MKPKDAPVPQRLKPRKTPVQSRSNVTVEAIHEAVIQVLLASGSARLTTTRVAERAGVSVGTLYQYFPNKEALLYAILRAHFEALAEAFEAVARDVRPAPLADLAGLLADTYVSVKTADIDATRALYRVAAMVDQVKLPLEIFTRMEAAVVALLAQAEDARFADPGRVAFTMLSALAGVSRSSFGSFDLGADSLTRYQEEARLLTRAYLLAAADATS